MKPSFDFYRGLSIKDTDLLILVGYHLGTSGIQGNHATTVSTNSYLIHISQDLWCNKVVANQRRVYAPGLACVVEVVRICRS
jgi:hypothetical protein